MKTRYIEMFLKLLQEYMNVVYDYNVLAMLIQQDGITFQLQEITPTGEKCSPYVLTFVIENNQLEIYNSYSINCITFPFNNGNITKEELNENRSRYAKILNDYNWFN